MKRFTLGLMLLILFSVSTFAQISKQNFGGDDSFVISLTYDIDSAATLTTNQFSLDDFDGGISATNPATFYFDNATDGAPATALNIEIIVYGVYNGSSYTFPIDTVIKHAANQGVDDSLGVLTFNKWSAPAYYITLNNTGGNGSGVCVISFPKRENARVSELDHSH